MRALNRLTVKEIEALKEPGRYGDGGNLYLVITKAGTRQWTFRYRWKGKEKELGLGSAAIGRVTLQQARTKAQDARNELAAGNDPQAARDAAKRATDLRRTWGQVVDEFLKTMERGWRNKKHANQWRYSLKVLAAPLSAKPVDSIGVTDVLAVLRPVWDRVPETGRRLRGRLEAVLSYATSHNYRAGENPARWKDNLKGLLPKRKRGLRRHHPALPYSEVPAFIAELRNRQADTALAAYALELTILTALRTSEVLHGKFTEIDLSKNIWTVPAARMKMGEEHRVPLSPRAVEIIRKLMETRWGDYLFPGNTINRPMSDMSMLMLLRRMGFQHVTVHGFRSTFRDWANETTSFPYEVCERALAHKTEDETQRAYARGDLLAKRAKLMSAWANYIEPKAASNVVQLSREKGSSA